MQIIFFMQNQTRPWAECSRTDHQHSTQHPPRCFPSGPPFFFPDQVNSFEQTPLVFLPFLLPSAPPIFSVFGCLCPFSSIATLFSFLFFSSLSFPFPLLALYYVRLYISAKIFVPSTKFITIPTW